MLYSTTSHLILIPDPDPAPEPEPDPAPEPEPAPTPEDEWPEGWSGDKHFFNYEKGIISYKDDGITGRRDPHYHFTT